MTVNSVKPVWVHWLKGCTTIFILTFLDQGSKYFVLTRLKNTPDIILIPGVLQLHYLENRGMAFGLFEGKIPVFVILCVLILCIFLCICTDSENRLLPSIDNNFFNHGIRRFRQLY